MIKQKNGFTIIYIFSTRLWFFQLIKLLTYILLIKKNIKKESLKRLIYICNTFF